MTDAAEMVPVHELLELEPEVGADPAAALGVLLAPPEDVIGAGGVTTLCEPMARRMA